MQLSAEDGRDGLASRPCRATVSPRQCSAYRRGSGSIAVGPSLCIRGPFAGSRVVDLAPRQDVSTQREGECAFQPAAHGHHDGVSVSEIRHRTCRYDVTTFWHSIKHETTRRIAARMVAIAAHHTEDRSGPGTRTTNPCGRVITRLFRMASCAGILSWRSNGPHAKILSFN